MIDLSQEILIYVIGVLSLTIVFTFIFLTVWFFRKKVFEQRKITQEKYCEELLSELNPQNEKIILKKMKGSFSASFIESLILKHAKDISRLDSFSFRKVAETFGVIK